MCPEKADLQAVLQVQEQESHVTVAPALKEELAKLPDANSTMDMRMPEGFHQLEQRIPTLVPGSSGQGRQALKNSRSNDERLSHVSCANRRPSGTRSFVAS